MHKSATCIYTALLGLTMAATHLHADSITLSNLQIIPTPFSSSFYPAVVLNLAINDSGSIAGSLLNSTVNPFPIGFAVPAGGSPIAIQAPGSEMTSVSGINNSGTLVGYSSSFGPNQGFTYSGGTFAPVTAGTSPELTGINNHGDIIGNQGGSAFLIHGSVITSFSVPGFSATTSSGLNDSDQVVGSAFNSTGPQSGYLRQSDGTITALNFVPFGINNAGIVVGDASQSNSGSIVMINGAEYTFSIPGASYTNLDAINNNDEVVGVYGEGFYSYIFEGQLAPMTASPEPAAGAALGMVLMSGLLLRRHAESSYDAVALAIRKCRAGRGE